MVRFIFYRIDSEGEHYKSCIVACRNGTLIISLGHHLLSLDLHQCLRA